MDQRPPTVLLQSGHKEGIENSTKLVTNGCTKK